MMHLNIRRQDGEREVRFTFAGVVDVDAATMLRAAAGGLGERPVVLDFRNAVVASDAALGAVLAALECPNVACVGLGHHHERVVRYFGVSPACPVDGDETKKPS